MPEEGTKLGRPSDYTPEMAAKICDRLVEGLSVREVCKAENMPAPSTVFLWLTKHTEFSEQYARALEARAEAMADDLLVIADDGVNDWVKTQEGGEAYNGDHVQRSKLRVDARKWLLSKMAPKKYGDKVTQELTGKDGAPLNTGPTIIFSGAPEHSSPPQAVGGASKRGD
jgi:hypothetical protein